MTVSIKRKNSSKNKLKSKTKSKFKSKTSSKKYLIKSKKNEYKSRKMRGGELPKFELPKGVDLQKGVGPNVPKVKIPSAFNITKPKPKSQNVKVIDLPEYKGVNNLRKTFGPESNRRSRVISKNDSIRPNSGTKERFNEVLKQIKTKGKKPTYITVGDPIDAGYLPSGKNPVPIYETIKVVPKDTGYFDPENLVKSSNIYEQLGEKSNSKYVVQTNNPELTYITADSTIKPEYITAKSTTNPEYAVAKENSNPVYITAEPSTKEPIYITAEPSTKEPIYITAEPSKNTKPVYITAEPSTKEPIYITAEPSTKEPIYITAEPSKKTEDPVYSNPGNLVRKKSNNNNNYVELGENPKYFDPSAKTTNEPVYFNPSEGASSKYLDVSKGEPTYQKLNQPSPTYNVIIQPSPISSYKKNITLGSSSVRKPRQTPPKYVIPDVKEIVPKDQLPENLRDKVVPPEVHKNIVGIAKRRLEGININSPEYRKKYNEIYKKFYNIKMPNSTKKIYIKKNEKKKHEEKFPKYEYFPPQIIKLQEDISSSEV